MTLENLSIKYPGIIVFLSRLYRDASAATPLPTAHGPTASCGRVLPRGTHWN